MGATDCPAEFSERSYPVTQYLLLIQYTQADGSVRTDFSLHPSLGAAVEARGDHRGKHRDKMVSDIIFPVASAITS